MKSIAKCTWRVIILLLLIVCMLSGSNNGNVKAIDNPNSQTERETATEPPLTLTHISFGQAKVTLTVGASKKLVVVVQPDNWKLADVRFESSNPGCVSVHPTSGLITALKPGQAVIELTVAGSDLKAACVVTVKEKVKLNKTKLTLNIGGKGILKAIGNGQTVKWSSANSKIAAVKNGAVSGIGVGTTKIYATVGKEKLACTVVVRKPVISKSKLSLYRGYKTKLTIKNISKKVIWSSSNNKVAVVSQNGTVQGKAVGKATITARINANYTLKCSIEVKRMNPSYSISLPSKGDNYCAYIFMYIKNTGTKPLTVYSKGAFMNDSKYREYDRYLSLVDPYTYKSKASETLNPKEAKYLAFKVEGKATCYDYKTVIYYSLKYDGKIYNCYSSRYYGTVFGI